MSLRLKLEYKQLEDLQSPRLVEALPSQKNFFSRPITQMYAPQACENESNSKQNPKTSQKKTI